MTEPNADLILFIALNRPAGEMVDGIRVSTGGLAGLCKLQLITRG
jgi:hypothetical protein